MQLGRSQYLLAILAVALACASPTRAAAAAQPTITLFVNGDAVDVQATFDPVGDLWLSQFTAAGDGWAIENGDASFSDNAFISYHFDAVNLSDSSVSFSLMLSIPFTEGPYNVVESSHSSRLTDGDLVHNLATNGRASMDVISGFEFVHNPVIDGQIVSGSEISQGCVLTGSPGFDKTCQGPIVLTAPISTHSAGTLGVAVSFMVSPKDAFFPEGGVTLVPEPRTDLLLLAGVAMVFSVIARRRIR